MILIAEKQLAKVLNITDRRVRELFKEEKNSDGTYPFARCVQLYIQQTREGDIHFVTIKTLSELIGLSEKTTRNYVNKGVFKKLPNGRYDIRDCLKSYLESKDEWNKKKAIERELAEFKLNIMKQNYHAKEEVKYILTDMLIKFKARLLGTAIKIDDTLDDIEQHERLNFLKNTLIDTLEELAEYEPPEKEKLDV